MPLSCCITRPTCSQNVSVALSDAVMLSTHAVLRCSQLTSACKLYEFALEFGLCGLWLCVVLVRLCEMGRKMLACGGCWPPKLTPRRLFQLCHILGAVMNPSCNGHKLWHSK